MSIPFSGTRLRSRGVISAIAKNLRNLTLKPVERIQIKFDPFNENSTETRNFLFHITTPKITATNPLCVVKTNIVCDQSEPIVTFKLASGENVVMKSTNLTALNILELYNKHITPLAPVESEDKSKQLLEDQKKKQKKRRVTILPGSKHRGVFL